MSAHYSQGRVWNSHDPLDVKMTWGMADALCSLLESLSISHLLSMEPHVFETNSGERPELPEPMGKAEAVICGIFALEEAQRLFQERLDQEQADLTPAEAMGRFLRSGLSETPDTEGRS